MTYDVVGYKAPVTMQCICQMTIIEGMAVWLVAYIACTPEASNVTSCNCEKLLGLSQCFMKGMVEVPAVSTLGY